MKYPTGAGVWAGDSLLVERVPGLIINRWQGWVTNRANRDFKAETSFIRGSVIGKTTSEYLSVVHCNFSPSN